MLFNKKPQEEVASDFATTYSEPRPSAHNSMSNGGSLMASRKSASAPTRSVIDAWLTINGNLESEGEIQVDGKVNGDIRCAQLIVGKDASIRGNITAEDVIVRGKVEGVIRANRVTLQDTSVVDSEIFHKSLAVEEGACFEGQSRRREEPMKIDLKALPTMAGEKAKSKVGTTEQGSFVAA